MPSPIRNDKPRTVILGGWDELGEDASAVRHAVFVMEQSVPAEIELDEYDTVCVHALVRDAEGYPVATGRLLPDGHIGRMAVLARMRGAGLGGLVLEALVAKGWELGHDKLALNAQTHARGFYEAHGFTAEGEEFMDAGIAHVLMTRARPE